MTVGSPAAEKWHQQLPNDLTNLAMVPIEETMTSHELGRSHGSHGGEVSGALANKTGRDKIEVLDIIKISP